MSYLDFIDPGNSGGSVSIPEYPPFRPAPIIYHCSVCGESFLNQDTLFEHRFANHKFRRPALILRGKEITSPREIIVSSLSVADIAFAETNFFRLNGEQYNKHKFVNELLRQTRGVVEILLANDGVETAYELLFDIPDIAEIAEVERLFFSLLGKEVMNIQRINSFIDAAEHYRSAARYIDGLTCYLYGVLAKDQRGDTHLEQHEYRAKFNMALETLKKFESPLALVICGIINFNKNIFICSEWLSPAPKLKQVMKRFFSLINGEGGEIYYAHTVTNTLPVPLDGFTERVMEWSAMNWNELSNRKKEIEIAIKSPNCVADDRFKAQILLTEMLVSLDDINSAKMIARTIVHDAIFGDWAQRIMDRSN